MSRSTYNPSIVPNLPKYFCRKCFALAKDPERFYKFSKKIDEPKIECPICTLMYIYTEDFSLDKFGEYLSAVGCSFEIKRADEHFAKLDKITENLRGAKGSDPGLLPGLLPGAISQAQAFIHFTSHEMELAIFRALKVASQRIPVRGIATVRDKEAIRETGEFGEVPTLLDMKFMEGDEKGTPALPQKILVIDGLLALIGMEHLAPQTEKEGPKKDGEIKFINDVDKVISLHNLLFSPLWAEFSELGERIFMDPI